MRPATIPAAAANAKPLSARSAKARAEMLNAVYLLAAMGAVALGAGFGAFRVFDDMLVSAAAAGLTVLMFVSLLDMAGIVGRR